MQRDCASVDDDWLLLRLLRIENEHHAFLAAERQLSTGNGEYLHETENLTIKAVGPFQIIHIE